MTGPFRWGIVLVGALLTLACSDRAADEAAAITPATAEAKAKELEGAIDQEIAMLRKSLPKPAGYVESGMPSAPAPSSTAVSSSVRSSAPGQSCRAELDTCVRGCDPSCSAAMGSISCRITAPSPGRASTEPLTSDQQRKLECVNGCVSRNASCQ